MWAAVLLAVPLAIAGGKPAWDELEQRDRRYLRDRHELDAKAWEAAEFQRAATWIAESRKYGPPREKLVSEMVAGVDAAASVEELKDATESASEHSIDDRVAAIWRPDLSLPLSAIIEARRKALEKSAKKQPAKAVEALTARYSGQGAARFGADADRSGRILGSISPDDGVPIDGTTPAAVGSRIERGEGASKLPTPSAASDDELKRVVITRLRDSPTGRRIFEDAGGVPIEIAELDAGWFGSYFPFTGTIKLDRDTFREISPDTGAYVLAEELFHATQHQRKVPMTTATEVEGRLKALQVFDELTGGKGAQKHGSVADTDANRLLEYLHGSHPIGDGFSKRDGLPGLVETIDGWYRGQRSFMFFKPLNARSLVDLWESNPAAAKIAQSHFDQVLKEHAKWRSTRKAVP